MPSMYVNVPTMERETKDALVAKLHEAAGPILKAPHVYTYVNEYGTIYQDGKPSPDHKMIVVNIEAGPTKAEKVEAIAAAMLDAVKESLGEDKKLTLVFHSNDLDRIAINGKLISSTLKK